MLLVKMKLHWFRMGSNSNGLYHYRRERSRFRLRHTHREDNQVKTDTEIGLKLLQVRENQRPSEAGTTKERFSPRAFRQSMDGLGNALILYFWPLDL